MKLQNLQTIIVILLVALVAISCNKEGVLNVSRRAEEHTFISQAVQDTFMIYINLPAGYDESSTTAYPVIFVLDADWVFHAFQQPYADQGSGDGCVRIIHGLIEDGAMPDAILVGIGYPGEDHRLRDLIFPADPTLPGSGGADNFYGFIKDELIPFVDVEYNTTGFRQRTIIGHSAGGYFTLFALFKSPIEHLFSHYLVISPSIFRSDYYVFGLESQYFEDANGVLDASLFMSVGSNDWAIMVDTFEAFRDTLTLRDYHDLRFRNELYTGEDHHSVFNPSVEEGLSWLFE